MRIYHKSYWNNVRQSKEVLVKRFLYNGCLVEIINNKRFSFKYEWVISPISPVMKRACARHKIKKMNDPTFHKTLEYAVYNAKNTVNELRSPFNYAHWKD